MDSICKPLYSRGCKPSLHSLFFTVGWASKADVDFESAEYFRDMKKLTTKGRSSKNDLQLNLSLSEPDNNPLGCLHQANFVRLNQASGVIPSDRVLSNQDSICTLSIKDSNKAHAGLKRASNSCVVLFSLENAKLEKQKNNRRELSKRILAYAEKLSW